MGPSMHLVKYWGNISASAQQLHCDTHLRNSVLGDIFRGNLLIKLELQIEKIDTIQLTKSTQTSAPF